MAVMMVAKLVCYVLFLFAFVVNRHSLHFIVGRGKLILKAFVSLYISVLINPAACSAVSKAVASRNGFGQKSSVTKVSGSEIKKELQIAQVSKILPNVLNVYAQIRKRDTISRYSERRRDTDTFGISLRISLADLITTTKASSKTYTNYLKTACNSTLYPQLCFESLSSYTSTIETDDLKLCSAALTVTLDAASNTSSLVKSISKQRGLSKTEAGIVKDCIDEMRDSIDELNQSFKALGSLKGSDIEFQISSIRTWMSAAITDENTCTDGFDDRKISDEVMIEIRKSIANVAMLTSNSLALINKLPY
ncbi:unnamed protein product [Dovyalis caffra]|uniref:Pectinesterase inhibitor domain-containing protein n=1 Tax=Dovyalis caffra TaxID=77055 RepID=A0AAV1RK32_9ROSI|nr:unnamed protein product [Dovyalis caffra]